MNPRPLRHLVVPRALHGHPAAFRRLVVEVVVIDFAIIAGDFDRRGHRVLRGIVLRGEFIACDPQMVRPRRQQHGRAGMREDEPLHRHPLRGGTESEPRLPLDLHIAHFLRPDHDRIPHRASAVDRHRRLRSVRSPLPAQFPPRHSGIHRRLQFAQRPHQHRLPSAEPLHIHPAWRIPLRAPRHYRHHQTTRDQHVLQSTPRQKISIPPQRPPHARIASPIPAPHKSPLALRPILTGAAVLPVHSPIWDRPCKSPPPPGSPAVFFR